MKWNQVTWYSRLVAIIIFVGVIPALCFYVGIQYEKYNQESQRMVEFNFSKELNEAEIKEEKEFLEGDWNKYEASIKFSKEPIVFTSPSGQTVVFKDYLYQARNPGSNLYVNDIDVGDIEGVGILNAYFSSESDLFYFQVIGVCGAGCKNTTYYSLDLNKLTIHRFDREQVNRELFPEDDVEYTFGVTVTGQISSAPNTYTLHLIEKFKPQSPVDYNIEAENNDWPLKVNDSYVVLIKYEPKSVKYVITDVLLRPIED